MSTETFDEFYGATAGRTLRFAYAMCGDHGVAQDLTQEAYIRAWQRWPRLADYDHPESWLRLVVTRLVTDRWRWLGVRNRATVHSGHWPTAAPPPSDDTIIINDALRRLPVRQRQAIVMHYLMDMPITAIAAETGVAIGTVKSWLSRGREGLAQVLNEGVPAAQASELRSTADRRRRKRTAIASVSAVLLAAVIGLMVYLQGHKDTAPPVNPSPSPSLGAQGSVPGCTNGVLDRHPYYSSANAHGRVAQIVNVRNISATACALTGAPRVDAVDKATGQTVTLADYAEGGGQVRINPGEEALVAFQYDADGACANPVVRSYREVDIYFPAGARYRLPDFELTWSCGELSVSGWIKEELTIDRAAQPTQTP